MHSFSMTRRGFLKLLGVTSAGFAALGIYASSGLSMPQLTGMPCRRI